MTDIIDMLAMEIERANREAIEATSREYYERTVGKIRPDIKMKMETFNAWDKGNEEMREHLRKQARYLLERFNITPKDSKS